MLMGELLHFFLLPKPVKVQEEESEKKQGISPDLPSKHSRLHSAGTAPGREMLRR